MHCFSRRYSYGESTTPSFNTAQNTLENKKPDIVATPASPVPPPPPPPPVVSPSLSKDAPGVSVSQTSIPGHHPISVHRTESTNSSTHHHYLQHKEEPLKTAEIMAYVNPVIRYVSSK